MSRKLFLGIASAAVFAGLMTLPLPSASAQQCVLNVTLASGQTLSFTVDVAPGTPLSSIPLPVKAPVAAISETCGQSSASATTTTSSQSTQSSSSSPSATGTTTTTTTTTGPTTHTTTTTTTTKPPPAAPHLAAGGTIQKPSPNHHSKPSTSRRTKTTPKGKPHSKKTTVTGATNQATAGSQATAVAPTLSNPAFSFSLPGASPLGVPNFFIDSFRIPPFLLPIYQAAGIEYDVPWQILSAINEIETDYGRNLSVSSAGAVGWMQFLPPTWKQYGVDANGDGIADPYNPVDAIFSAARYLHAAGASKNLGGAILAYNHATWYMQSVLLRAKLIGGMPGQLIDALSGLVEGHFPVAAPAKYADDSVERLATQRASGANAALPVNSQPNSNSVTIFAKHGSPVIAVNDGKIVNIGQSAKLGKFVQLQDATGNIYTYADLGSVPGSYPVPLPIKITAAQIAKELSQAPPPTPSAPATAGQQVAPTATAPIKPLQTSKAPRNVAASPAQAQGPLPSVAVPTPVVKERLFAYPERPASYAAGGKLQLQNESAQITSFQNYFSDVLHLGHNQYSLEPLKAGSIVVAGTILGRIAEPSATAASHLLFMIQPAGKNAPQIDPKPILDGWKLLQATAVYRAAGKDPFFGPAAKNPTVGQVLLMSKEQLTQRILADPHVQIYSCGRRDIAAGLIQRQVLATIEFLAGSGLDPSVSGLECGHGSGGTDAARSTGASVEISGINGTRMLGHQGAGSITDITIRRLLTLQGAMKPNEIISTMSYKGQPNTLALPDHKDRIQVVFTPLFGQNKKLSAQIASILNPGQWVKLINRISQIPEPIVPIAPSQYAIKVGR